MQTTDQPAFCASGALSTSSLLPRHHAATSGRRAARPRPRGRRAGGAPAMLIPAKGYPEPPLTDAQRGPEGYTWDEDFPGTLKPGQVEDNFPLQRVLESDVYERMHYEEMDLDERTPHIFEPDEDLLEWLAREGRLLPKDVDDDEIDEVAEKTMVTMTDDDLDYGDDESKMLEYYSKQSSGVDAGAGNDFGGFSESSTDVGAGF